MKTAKTAALAAAIAFLPLAAVARPSPAPAPAPTPTPAASQATNPANGDQTMTIVDRAMYHRTSYRGQPDLALALALVAAGGGPDHFDAARLYAAMAGSHAAAEEAALRRKYGSAKVAAFLQTFTAGIDDLLHLVSDNHVAMPSAPVPPADDGRAIALALYSDGIMADGRFDCGYMMEHVMSHPLHVALMHDLDAQPGEGPRRNAVFHVILTAVVKDLHAAYARDGRPAFTPTVR